MTDNKSIHQPYLRHVESPLLGGGGRPHLVPAAPVQVAHLDDVADDVGAAVVHGLAPLHLGKVLPPVGDRDLQGFGGILYIFPNCLSIRIVVLLVST